MRLLLPSGILPVHHGHMWNGQCKALVITESREMRMCQCVDLFPEHIGILHISNLFFTSEDIFLCNWKINVFFCTVSTEDIINLVLRVSQIASIFKWDLTGSAYLYKKTIQTFWSLLRLDILFSEKKFFQLVTSRWFLVLWNASYCLEEFSCMSWHVW